MGGERISTREILICEIDVGGEGISTGEILICEIDVGGGGRKKSEKISTGEIAYLRGGGLSRRLYLAPKPSRGQASRRFISRRFARPENISIKNHRNLDL